MMKNLFQKKIFIVGISILGLCFSNCNNTNTESNSSSGNSLNPDLQHKPVETTYSKEVLYDKSEFPIIDPDDILIDSLFIQVAYKIGSNRFLLIARKFENDTEGLKLLIVDPSDNYKLIYRSKGSFESMTLHPTFFVPNKADQPTVVLCSVGMLESWGQRLFIMKGDVVNDIDYIDVAAKIEVDSAYTEKGFEFIDVGPYSKVGMDESGIHLTFHTDSIIYFGGKGDLIDPIIEANSLEYVYYDGVLRTIWRD